MSRVHWVHGPNGIWILLDPARSSHLPLALYWIHGPCGVHWVDGSSWIPLDPLGSKWILVFTAWFILDTHDPAGPTGSTAPCGSYRIHLDPAGSRRVPMDPHRYRWETQRIHGFCAGSTLSTDPYRSHWIHGFHWLSLGPPGP